MNTTLVREADSRPQQTDKPTSIPVRATFKSGRAVILETTIPFPAAPSLGQDFDINRLPATDQAQLDSFSRRGYLYKIGSGKDGVPEVEIAVEAAASHSELKLNSARIPHSHRAAVAEFLERELGSFSVAWELDHAAPLVIAKEPSGASPSAETLGEGIQSVIACPMNAG
ncbi:hypothetical protein [Luteolibacter luteus]|uniref:Uncharacterized protein n=1 Tax=Luteolibacter luteus TaxID=2728835 RepID=A0A858RSR8_9BACT|nr:hypothetical protein [Luteolibacter luteus]QJE99023.1 hypothetical protein HHL09_25660 [Luteolibacter luteus]